MLALLHNSLACLIREMPRALSPVLIDFMIGAVGSPSSRAQSRSRASCKSFEKFVGGGKVNIVDFRREDDAATSPFIFRLAYTNFHVVPADHFFRHITTGQMTFSYPRQNDPELPYNAQGTLAQRFTQGPAYGDTVNYQAREIACNVFEIHWEEPKRGDTVTHIEDFGHEQVCTNIAGINRVPIPQGFDPLDTSKQLNSLKLFPKGNPVTKPEFDFVSLCGKMTQSPASTRVWENKLHNLVYTSAN